MPIISKWIYTLSGIVMAVGVLWIEKIGSRYLLVPVDQYQVDIFFSVLLVIAGVLLDVNIHKMNRVRVVRNKLRQANRELDEKNAALVKSMAEVKVLSGLLPICCSCNKIRDDKGYWQRLEAYIQKRTDAVFSHGLCPDCMEKLYPEYMEKLKRGRM